MKKRTVPTAAFFSSSLIVVALTVWFVGTAAAATPPSPPTVTIPPLAAPLAVGSDGLPDAAIAAMLDRIEPGTSQLVAVQPARGGHWFAPAAPIQGAPGSQEVAMATNASPTTGSQPHPLRRLARAAESQYADWGCQIDAFDPVWVYQGAIQGLEDFVSCTGLGETDAEVCMKDSSTYGLHACEPNVHEGNASWVAESQAFACQNVSREWMSTGTNTYYNTSGQGALWAFASPWGDAITC